MLKRGGQYICAATSTGAVQLLESKTLTVLKMWKAHAGWISDMDANASFLVTCGYSPKATFGGQPDPLVKVFDLKSLLPLAPVQFHGGGASYIRLHPRMLSIGIIASVAGQLQTTDFTKGSMVNVRHVSLVDAHLVGLEISPSGEAFALADSSCFIQLWGTPAQLRFTYNRDMTSFADASSLQDSRLDWENDDSYQEPFSTNNAHKDDPYNAIGVSYYWEPLFSMWPNDMISEAGAPPYKIDPDILVNAGLSDRPRWVLNTRGIRRNQTQRTRMQETHKSIEVPKFLSEQAKYGEERGRRMSEVLDILTTDSEDQSKFDIPAMYENVKIQYSRFGVDDFDFGYVPNALPFPKT